MASVTDNAIGYLDGEICFNCCLSGGLNRDCPFVLQDVRTKQASHNASCYWHPGNERKAFFSCSQYNPVAWQFL